MSTPKGASSSNKKVVNTKPVGLADMLHEAQKDHTRVDTKNENRVMVITLVAKIDNSLIKLLQRTLTPSNHDNEDFLADNGIINSLVLRAKLCLRLGLISPSLYDLIKFLSKIRNDCSHNPERFNVFTKQTNIDKINNYWNRMNPELMKRSVTDPAKRFEEMCEFTNINLVILTRQVGSKNFRNNEVLFSPNTGQL